MKRILLAIYNSKLVYFFREWILYLGEFFSPKGHIYVDISIPYCIKDNYNWGDDINKVLMEFISGRKVIPSRCMIRKKEHFLCIGSIIQWYSDENAIIWGSGLLKCAPVKGVKKICAVRGPLTRQELLRQGFDCPEVYGDPALLFPRYYFPTVKKLHKIGIIAHFYELKDPQIKKIIAQEDYFFIDIQHYGKWNSFIDKVLSCEYIISSSLHGCIISDAYNVPNIWCQFTDYVAEDGGFKFRDYYLSIGRSITVPYDLTHGSFSVDIIISHIKKSWEYPDFDLDSLMDACPFVLNKAYEKKNCNFH